MEALIREVRSTSENLSHDVDIVCKTCTRYNEAISRFTKAPPPAFPSTTFNPEYISGFAAGETHHIAFTALNTLFTDIFSQLSQFSQTLSTAYGRIDKGDAKWIETANSTISSVDNAAAPLIVFLDSIPTVSKSQTPRKIAQLLSTLTVKGKAAKAEAKKLQKLVTDLIHDRNRPDAISSQRQIFERATGPAAHFCQASARLLPICQFRARILNEVLEAMQNCCTDVGAELGKTAQSLRAAADAIRHRQDFERFVERSSLIRYDLQCNPFVPIDLSHPVFSDIDTKIQVAVPPIYPIGIGIVNEDFVAEGTNELSVTHGKHVLLMEWPGTDWICVMNPLTRARGYAPTAVVSRIGQALGVVVEVGVVGGEVYLQRGDYLAVTGAAENQWNTVTTRGEAVTILKEHVAIIYD
jgi:hypothetical protein